MYGSMWAAHKLTPTTCTNYPRRLVGELLGVVPGGVDGKTWDMRLYGCIRRDLCLLLYYQQQVYSAGVVYNHRGHIQVYDMIVYGGTIEQVFVLTHLQWQ